MPKCLICNSDREFHKLAQHLRTIHKMSVDEYKELYPDAETVSAEYSSTRSKLIKKLWETGRMDTEAKREQYQRFNQMGIDYRRSDKGRKEASDLQKNIWESKTPEEQKVIIDRKLAGAKHWRETHHDEFMAQQSYAASKSGKSTMTSIHLKVSDYLLSLGINHINEYYIKGVNVDIYIPSMEKVIECNGEFWHGDPTKINIEDMSYYQRNGYRRDLRRRNIFGDNVLFLWESEINNRSFENKLREFLKV